MHTERFNNPNDPNLAIFIMRTGDGTHTGILHQMRGELIIQDMQWHELFRSKSCSRAPDFVSFALEPEEEHRVRGMCRLIHDRQNSQDPSKKYRIPYAFRHGNNNCFDRDPGEAAGDLMLVDGLGLTCSTFVLTVFQSVAVPLVSFDGWEKREEDNARHEALLDKMQKGIPEHGILPAHPDHVERVKGELPCIQVRPKKRQPLVSTMISQLLSHSSAPAGEWILAQIPLPDP